MFPSVCWRRPGASEPKCCLFLLQMKQRPHLGCLCDEWMISDSLACNGLYSRLRLIYLRLIETVKDWAVYKQLTPIEVVHSQPSPWLFLLCVSIISDIYCNCELPRIFFSWWCFWSAIRGGRLHELLMRWCHHMAPFTTVVKLVSFCRSIFLILLIL